MVDIRGCYGGFRRIFSPNQPDQSNQFVPEKIERVKYKGKREKLILVKNSILNGNFYFSQTLRDLQISRRRYGRGLEI